MSSIKNFGFGEPFIKTAQSGRYLDVQPAGDDRFDSDDADREGFWASRMPRIGAPSRSARRPDFSWRSFKQWHNKARADWKSDPADEDPAWRPFEEARAFARKLGLDSADDWSRYVAGDLPAKGRRPNDIPDAPDVVYADAGWSGYADWLTGDR